MRFIFQSCFLFIVLLSCSELTSNNITSPGETYRAAMGNGFATDWFKSETPTSLHNKYTQSSLVKTLRDLKSKGFTSLRLRSRADVWGFPDKDAKKFIAAEDIDKAGMAIYLEELENAVDTMIAEGMFPVISWIHHHAEGRANRQDGDNFVAWWTAVAERLKHKSYNLAFNLMTEVGKQDEDGDGINGVYDQIDVYNDWTLRAIQAIRGTGSNNVTRIIIITGPRNTKEESLSDVSDKILRQTNLMLEYHSYAAGPGRESQRNPWNGTGSAEDKKKLTERLEVLSAFTKRTNIPIYWGAWMAKDNNDKTLHQAERDAFAAFFVEQLKTYNIPWGMNKLGDFYDMETNEWLTTGESVYEPPSSGGFSKDPKPGEEQPSSGGSPPDEPPSSETRDKPYQTLQAIMEAMR